MTAFRRALALALSERWADRSLIHRGYRPEAARSRAPRRQETARPGPSGSAGGEAGRVRRPRKRPVAREPAGDGLPQEHVERRPVGPHPRADGGVVHAVACGVHVEQPTTCPVPGSGTVYVNPVRAPKSRAWASRSARFSSRVIGWGHELSPHPGVPRMCSTDDDHASWSGVVVLGPERLEPERGVDEPVGRHEPRGDEGQPDICLVQIVRRSFHRRTRGRWRCRSGGGVGRHPGIVPHAGDVGGRPTRAATWRYGLASLREELGGHAAAEEAPAVRQHDRLVARIGRTRRTRPPSIMRPSAAGRGRPEAGEHERLVEAEPEDQALLARVRASISSISRGGARRGERGDVARHGREVAASQDGEHRPEAVRRSR